MSLNSRGAVFEFREPENSDELEQMLCNEIIPVVLSITTQKVVSSWVKILGSSSYYWVLLVACKVPFPRNQRNNIFLDSLTQHALRMRPSSHLTGAFVVFPYHA